MGSLRAKAGSDRANIMGRLRSDTLGGEGGCMQTVLGEFPKFCMGRPNSNIKHTGHARVPTEAKGQSQVEPGTKQGEEVKSRANGDGSP